MKKILLFAMAALILSPVADAQIPVTPFKIDKNSLLKEIERSDKTLENEKRAARGQTWLDRGEAFYKISAAVASQIYGGMELKELNSKIGKEFTTTEKTLNDGKTYKVISIPEVDIYLVNDVIQFWVEKDVILEGASDKAVEAFMKAAELDPKLAPKAKDGLIRVSDIFKMNANSNYNMDKPIIAAEEFYKAYLIQKDPLVGAIDSSAVFNAGYLYITENNFEKAIEIFEDAIEHDVWADGNIAYFLSWAYLQTGEKNFTKAKDVLQKAYKLFPENESITEGLINYYSLTQGDFSEITDVLEGAIKKDPSKINYWSALTQAYTGKEDREKAIEFLRRFVRQFPDEFVANYYLGDELMEKGEKLTKEAETNTSMSQSQKDELMAQAIAVFNEALPPLMKAYNEKPDELATVQRVTRVLYYLKDEPGKMDEFEKFYDLERSMTGQKQ